MDAPQEDPVIPMPGVLGACFVLAAIVMIVFMIGFGIGAHACS